MQNNPTTAIGEKDENGKPMSYQLVFDQVKDFTCYVQTQEIMVFVIASDEQLIRAKNSTA